MPLRSQETAAYDKGLREVDFGAFCRISRLLYANIHYASTLTTTHYLSQMIFSDFRRPLGSARPYISKGECNV